MPTTAAVAMTPEQQAEAVAHVLEQHAGQGLLALYLYGSYVAGGLRPASDLDLLAVLQRPLAVDARAALMTALLGLSSPPGSSTRRALEVTCVVHDAIVPWKPPAVRELQFGEWLRDALLAGETGTAELDPDLALLLTQARANGIAIRGPAPASLLPAIPAQDMRDAMYAMLPELARNLIGEEKHALLTLARMWVTLDRGDIVSKDVAAAIVAPQLPEAHRAALERARAVYLGDADDDWRGWETRVEACAHAIASTLVAWRRPTA